MTATTEIKQALAPTTRPAVASVGSFKFQYPPREHAVGAEPGSEGDHFRRKRNLATLSMEGKVCCVTGAARGLGNVIARAFIEAGSSQVAIVDLHQGDADQAAKEMEEWFVDQGEAHAGELQIQGFGCDVADESKVRSVFDAIHSAYGHIDVVVTAAGIVENWPALQYPVDRIATLFNINVNGTFTCAREAAKHMISYGRRGSIIMIGSMSGSIVNLPQPQMPYNASKAAVRHMAASLAVEWAPHQIRVNCISPGYMITSLTQAILDKKPDLQKKWIDQTPQGRLGNPENLKGAAIYLSSDAALYTTGIDLRVDGAYICV